MTSSHPLHERDCSMCSAELFKPSRNPDGDPSRIFRSGVCKDADLARRKLLCNREAVLRDVSSYCDRMHNFFKFRDLVR